MFTYSNNKMKRIIPYTALIFLTGFTAISGVEVNAGGCNSNMNIKREIKCAEDDIECQNDKAEKLELNKTLRS